MSPDERAPSPAQQWEERLVSDYYDHRWRTLMEPLCDKMQLWKAGKLSHADMDQTLERVHNQICELRNVLSQRHDRLVLLIQWLDREWFTEWVKEYSPPPGARLAPPTE